MLTRRQSLGLGLTLGGAALAAGLGGAAFGGPDLRDYEAAAAREREPVSVDPPMRELLRLATLAPNSHNTQPWRFLVSPGRVALEPDVSRRTPVVDPDDHHLFISLGAAAETLALASAAAGRSGALSFTGGASGSILFDHESAAPSPSPLAAAITARQTMRLPFASRPVESDILTALAASVKGTGAELILVTDPAAIAAVGALIVEASNVQMTDPAFRAELKSWMRFNPAEALGRGDGLFTGASGNPSLPSLVAPFVFDLFVTARSEAARTQAALAGTAGLAIIVSPSDEPAAWVEAGRACQRLLLQATLSGLRQSFVNQAVEVPATRAALGALLGIPGDARPDVVIRFGYPASGTADLPRSLRRGVMQVMATA